MTGMLVARHPSRPESVVQRDLGNRLLENDPNDV